MSKTKARATGATGALTHVDAQGRIRMVDVGDKPVTDREAIARGSISTVCCEWHSPGGLTSIVIPEWIREKLAPYVEDDQASPQAGGSS